MVTKEVETTVERVETQEVIFCDRCGEEGSDPIKLYTTDPEETDFYVDENYDVCKNCIREFDETRDVIALPPEDLDAQPTITRTGFMGWIGVAASLIGLGLALGYPVIALLPVFMAAFWGFLLAGIKGTPAIHED